MGRQFIVSEDFEDTMRRQVGSVPVDLRPMLPGFLIRREKELIELHRLLDSRDYRAIRDIAHKLKGTGGGFGLPIITEIGRELERAALAENPEEIAAMVKHLENVAKFLRLDFAA